MARKQTRIKAPQLVQSASGWLGRAASVVLGNGAVFELHSLTLEENRLLGRDHSGIRHSFPLADIRELILDFPVAEHAQTPAD